MLAVQVVGPLCVWFATIMSDVSRIEHALMDAERCSLTRFCLSAFGDDGRGICCADNDLYVRTRYSRISSFAKHEEHWHLRI